MNTPILKLTQIQEGWQAIFAYQVFHRRAEDWLRMRWGFNAGALLDEALDRYNLFVSSQTVDEAEFKNAAIQNNTLALRGIYVPESGLKMILLGKSQAASRELAQQAARQYAQEVFSLFPYDFLLEPVQTENSYNEVSGEYLFSGTQKVTQIQRGELPVLAPDGHRCFGGIWHSNARSNEQIWRSLSIIQQPVLLNIMIQPFVLSDVEKKFLLEIKNTLLKFEKDEKNSSYISWMDNYIERRLGAWKRFFLAQIHLVSEEPLGNIARAIGSALTKDTYELTTPGYKTNYPSSADENKKWCEDVRLLKLTDSTFLLDDIADTDEVFSIFRFPYRPEMGLPGTNFVEPNR